MKGNFSFSIGKKEVIKEVVMRSRVSIAFAGVF